MNLLVLDKENPSFINSRNMNFYTPHHLKVIFCQNHVSKLGYGKEMAFNFESSQV